MKHLSTIEQANNLLHNHKIPRVNTHVSLCVDGAEQNVFFGNCGPLQGVGRVCGEGRGQQPAAAAVSGGPPELQGRCHDHSLFATAPAADI